MERIGIYGGTFNPPHIGHLRAAEQAIESLRLDKLLLIPAHVAPHKELPINSPTSRQRLEMLQLAAAGHPKMKACDIELKRDDVSYTYETVNQLRSKYPDAKLYLMMGTDMFLAFPNWRNPEQILRQVTLAVFYRGDKGEEKKIEAHMEKMKALGAAYRFLKREVRWSGICYI